MTINEIVDTIKTLDDMLERIRLQYHDGIAEILVFFA